jgi:hypothetical protein
MKKMVETEIIVLDNDEQCCSEDCVYLNEHEYWCNLFQERCARLGNNIIRCKECVDNEVKA